MPSWCGQTAALTSATLFDTLINTKFYMCYGYSLKVRESSRFCIACGMQHSDQFPIAGVSWEKISSHVQKLGERVRAAANKRFRVLISKWLVMWQYVSLSSHLQLHELYES